MKKKNFGQTMLLRREFLKTSMSFRNKNPDVLEVLIGSAGREAGHGTHAIWLGWEVTNFHLSRYLQV